MYCSGSRRRLFRSGRRLLVYSGRQWTYSSSGRGLTYIVGKGTSGRRGGGANLFV